MAKLKFGAIVTDGRGKLGGHVIAKQKGTAYIKTNTAQKKQNSIKNSTVKSRTSYLMSLWSTLTDAQRNLWEEQILNYPYKNEFGERRFYSGFGLFCKCNQGLLKSGLNVLLVPGPVDNGGMVDLASVIITDTEINIGFESQNLDTYTAVYATKGLSKGISNPDRYFKLIGVWDWVTFTFPFNFLPAYESVFGSVVPNTHIHFGFEIISELSGYSNNVKTKQNTCLCTVSNNLYNGANVVTLTPNEVYSLNGIFALDCTQQLDPFNKVNGVGSVQFLVPTTANGRGFMTLSLETFTQYRVRFWALPTNTNFAFFIINGSGVAIGANMNINQVGWNEYEALFTTNFAPNPAVIFNFYPSISIAGSDSLNIDSITLEKVE